MPCEERVMRARELAGMVSAKDVWSEARTRFVNDATQQDFEDHLIRVSSEHAIRLAFSDEGSGIGELREALRPYLQHKVGCRNRLRMGQRDCSCGLSDILSPDIDRSGLAQEVE